jgi:2,3-bisphosphoglycerate-independent phosphoglycerate mutase
LFLDGVGLGVDDPGVNPFASAHAPTLAALAGGPWLRGLVERREAGRTVLAIDPTLGSQGRPQSATGQTTLLTGRDAVAAMGGPYGPWPGPTLQRLLEEGNLFHDGVRRGGARLANAYPQGYLDALAARAGRHRRARASTAMVAAAAAGVPLLGLEDRARGDAVAADLDGGGLMRMDPMGGGADVVREARRLALLAGACPFTYLDVWVTDQAGHRGDLASAVGLVERLDRFVAALRAALPGHVTLLVTSDHGNLEDAGDPRHSHNPVPLIALGPRATAFAGVRDLRGVAPAVRAAWADGG